jgi:hypothetical protein
LKIHIRFLDQLVIWEGAKMPFKPVEASVTTDYHIAQSMAVEEHTDLKVERETTEVVSTPTQV